MKHRKSSTIHVEDKTASEIDPAALLQQLTPNKVQVPKRDEVLAYMVKFPQLGELVPAICARVRKTFGSQVELSLELYRDPEIEDRYLTLYIRQVEYNPNIMERIEGVSRLFDRGLEKVPGSFLITTDFCPPRGKYGV